MAYNADNEIREELVRVKKNNRGDYVIATKITNKTSGAVSVDIRQYYTDDNDEVRVTSKGVRFNAEMLADVLGGLVKALEYDELESLSELINGMVDEDDIDEDSGDEEDYDDSEEEDSIDG